MSLPDRYYLHLLNCFHDFGPKRLLRLANYFPDFATAFHANRTDLIDAGLEPNIIEKWLLKKNEIDVDGSLQKLEQSGIGLVVYDDETYPQLLRQIPQPPPLLYYRGKLADSEELCVAVVGTRKISPYGRSITPELVAPLVERMTIVSGLAYGVDALAHQTTLDNSGRTIAVLGCGLDDPSIYPRHHVALANEIIDHGGLLLSEYPPGRPALAQHFVARNRIIAGLSKGVLVIECSLKSGALITADHAKDQDREVYAVPGPIYSPGSQGPYKLLKEGATLVTNAQDIIEDLKIEINLQTAPRNFASLTPQEQIVLDLVTQEPILVDDILASINLEPHVVTAALTFLEIKGQIRNVGGQQYVRK